MNKLLITSYSKQLDSIIPAVFLANSNRYTAGTDKASTHNYLMFKDALCIRFWLYLDFSLEPSKALRWIGIYSQLDQLSAEKALNSIYEFIRRENLLQYSVSQFKAALGKPYGISVRWWLGPLWYRVENLLLKDSALVSESEYISLVRDIVQWTRLSSKLKLENPSVEEEAYSRFEANELRLRDLWSKPDEVREQYLMQIAEIVDQVIDQTNFQPGLGHHGSGAVFEKEAGRHTWKKHKFLFRTDDRAEFFDKRFAFAINPQQYESFNCPVTRDLPVEARPSTVPKNIEKVRMIAMQAVGRMYRQEAVLQGYYEQWLKTPYFVNHFPIFDRTVNQRQALKASRSNRYCTIDLQSASDSISVHLVKACTKKNLRAALLLNRSKSIGRVELKETYATMGDATVFPTETLLIGAAVQLALNLSRSIDPKIPNRFWVFGDDIICSNHPEVIARIHDIFSRIGFIINDDKSFFYGPYRESCGVEAYLGHSIEPWYARLPVDSISRFQSLIGAANTCLDKGLRYVRRFLINEYAKGMKCSVSLLPFTENLEDSSRFHTYDLCLSRLRCARTPNGDIAFGQLERKELVVTQRVSSAPPESELSADDAYKLTQWYYSKLNSEMTELRLDVRFHQIGQRDLIIRRRWASVEDLLQ